MGKHKPGVVIKNPAQMTTLDKAVALGRPIEHGDFNPVPIRTFFTEFLADRGIPFPLVFGGTVPARLDAGRWLADCPLDNCHGAEMVDTTDPVFVCLSCGSGSQQWAVEFPLIKTDIDAEVSKRQDIHGWAWDVGETLDDLEAETERLRD